MAALLGKFLELHWTVLCLAQADNQTLREKNSASQLSGGSLWKCMLPSMTIQPFWKISGNDVYTTGAVMGARISEYLIEKSRVIKQAV